jgi:hypothetical protein
MYKREQELYPEQFTCYEGERNEHWGGSKLNCMFEKLTEGEEKAEFG